MKSFIPYMVIGLLFFGCVTLAPFSMPHFENKELSPFNHYRHVVLEELSCKECHKNVGLTDKVNMPSYEGCTDCHDEETRPPRFKQLISMRTGMEKKKIKWEKVGEKIQWLKPPKTFEEVKFSHKIHVPLIMSFEDWKSCLEEKKPSEDIRQYFKKRGFPLSDKSTIKEVEKGKRWFIIDDKQKYPVVLKEKKVKVIKKVEDEEEDEEEGEEEEGQKKSQESQKKTVEETKTLQTVYITFYQKKDFFVVTCKDCHGDIDVSKSIYAQNFPTMSMCIRCHRENETGGPLFEQCSKCHKEIRKEKKPASHKRLWKYVHGDRAKILDRKPCFYCHEEETFCFKCHQVTPPRSHISGWREGGHGYMAEVDRDRCIMCHTSDFCVRCHENTKPLNHIGSWGRGGYTHCVNCHFPLQDNSCLVCHKGTPSHSTAPPMASTVLQHYSVNNCFDCHPAPINVPHPYTLNVAECQYCHRRP